MTYAFHTCHLNQQQKCKKEIFVWPCNAPSRSTWMGLCQNDPTMTNIISSISTYCKKNSLFYQLFSDLSMLNSRNRRTTNRTTGFKYVDVMISILSYYQLHTASSNASSSFFTSFCLIGKNTPFQLLPLQFRMNSKIPGVKNMFLKTLAERIPLYERT